MSGSTITGSVASPSTGGLSVAYDDLRRAIGRFLGHGSDPSDWDSDPTQNVGDALLAGLRRFYMPPPLQGERYSHEWSFLTPATTLATVAEDGDYDLPADFGGLAGGLTYSPGDSAYCPEIVIVTDEMIRIERQQERSGRPTKAAIRPKTLDATTGTRYEIVFEPIPDAAYTLQYRYRVNPGILTSTNKYPYGGPEHAETIREACLSAAESMFRDSESVHEKRFLECLAASVSHDRKVAAPRTLGYNHDASDQPFVDDWRTWRDLYGLDNNIVTLNGVAY